MFFRGPTTILTLAVLCLAIAAPAYAGFAGTELFLPAVGAASGVPPSVWYTTVWVHNPGATRANITFFLLERQANTAPLHYTDTLQAGESRKYDDAVQLMFGKETFGALRITSDQRVVVSCRIYSQDGTALDESSGQFFAGVPASFAIAAGESTEVIGAHQTRPPAGSNFRFNFGFVEVTGSGTCRVEVTVKDSIGVTLGAKTYTVGQWEQMQMAFANEFGAISSENARLTVEVLSGEGKVIAFGSSVANGSQDPSTLEMAYADSLLGEITPGGISGVTAGMGLSGGGTTGSVTLDVGAGDGIDIDSDSVGLADCGVTTAKLANAVVTKGKLSAPGGTSGQVLGTDGSSLVWQDGSGFRLPFEGSANTSGGALKVTNTGSGYGTYGIEGHGFEAGFFESNAGTGSAVVGARLVGIIAKGEDGGGRFENVLSDSWANVAAYGVGIVGSGTDAGGQFHSSHHSGFAWVARGDRGISAEGADMGGYFSNVGNSGYANVAYGDYGIAAYGDSAGGSFGDLDSSSWADVGTGSNKIRGTGAVSFVQNHPHDPSSVIVYAAPEGDEVATYTRGTARLVDGEARVPLGETFRWVTNPDIGLTAHVTPREDCNGVYVAELSTAEVLVRELYGGTSDCAFDYMIHGLRIGFESLSIVQEKEREAYIPSMADHRQLYERRPDLEGYNALERFKAMQIAIGEGSEPDLSRAHALRDAIVEFDPAVHELPGSNERPAPEAALPAAVTDHRDARVVEEGLGDGTDDGDAIRAGSPASRVADTHIPVDAEGNIHATSFRSSSRDLATLLDASEAVEPGDVLVIDRANAGMMRRAFEASDTGVIGVVVAAPGVVLGIEQPPSRTIGPSEVENVELMPDHGASTASPPRRAAVALAGVVRCKVDASYGAIWPGDLLVTSPTPGHAMRADVPLPGTMLGKALQPLEEGTGTIDVLVMLR